MPCLPRETLKSRMMDHGSERQKVGRDGGVFHCYIAAYGHERPCRRRKPSVEGRAGPWEASGVRRCYVAFSVARKGLSCVDACRAAAAPERRWPVLAFNAGLVGQRGLGDELSSLRTPTLVLAGAADMAADDLLPLSDDGAALYESCRLIGPGWSARLPSPSLGFPHRVVLGLLHALAHLARPTHRPCTRTQVDPRPGSSAHTTPLPAPTSARSTLAVASHL